MATAVPLPPGLMQFCDANGAPYAGGQVIFYIPGGTTPKTTWQDPNQDIPNTNPIILDAAGRANIWGSGLYRQQLWDKFGNLIWDVLTETPDDLTTATFSGDSGSGGTPGLVPGPPAGSAAAGWVLQANGGFGPLLVVVPTAPAANQAGFLFVPQRTITTTTGALLLSDAGCNITYNDASNGTLTITADATALWVSGVVTQIMLNNLPGSGTWTLTEDAGVSLIWPGVTSTAGNRVLAANGQCLLSRIGVNTWTVVGAGLS